MRSSPTPSAPSPTAAPAPVDVAEVREDLDRRPVAGDRGLGGALEGRGVARRGGGGRRLVARGGVRVGVDADRAGVAVEQHAGAVGRRRAARAQPDDRRHAQRPGDDRRVAGRPAVRGRDARDVRGIERRGIAGQQLVGHEHLARGARGGGLAEQRADDAAADVADVRRALAQVGVVEALVLRGDGLGRVVDRARGVAVLARRSRARAGPSSASSEASAACASKIAASSAAAAPHEVVARGGQVVAHLRERVVEARRLRAGVVGVARRGWTGHRRCAARGRRRSRGRRGCRAAACPPPAAPRASRAGRVRAAERCCGGTDAPVHAVAEAGLRQLADRVDDDGSVRAVRLDLQGVAAAHAQQRDLREAAGARRAAPGRRVGEPQRDVVAGRDLHEPRGGPRVQPEAVGHEQLGLGVRRPRLRRRGRPAALPGPPRARTAWSAARRRPQRRPRRACRRLRR